MVKVSTQASRGQFAKATSVAVNNTLAVDASEAKAHLSPIAKVKTIPKGKVYKSSNQFSNTYLIMKSCFLVTEVIECNLRRTFLGKVFKA